jgi:chemotaxis protein methyltransferase CheR
MRSLDNINLENSYAQDGKDFIFTDDDFKKISSKIYTLAGIVLRPEKKGMVYARLLKRIKELNIASFSDYLSYLNTMNRKKLFI